MLATEPRALLSVRDPARVDVLAVADAARVLGAALVAHPVTLDELHVALVAWGPMCARTTLAAALRDVEVCADRSVPRGLVVLAQPAGGGG